MLTAERVPDNCPALVLNADYRPLSYFPLSLWSWQDTIKAVFLERVNIVAQYDKAVQTAFREVADALAVSATLDERLSAQEALYEATRRQLNLAEVTYRAGGSSQLDLLDAQRTLYAAELALITLRQAAQSNRIALYKALGGGWNSA